MGVFALPCTRHEGRPDSAGPAKNIGGIGKTSVVSRSRIV